MTGVDDLTHYMQATAAGRDLAEAVEAFLRATVPSVSDEWTKLGEALGTYRRKVVFDETERDV